MIPTVALGLPTREKTCFCSSLLSSSADCSRKKRALSLGPDMVGLYAEAVVVAKSSGCEKTGSRKAASGQARVPLAWVPATS